MLLRGIVVFLLLVLNSVVVLAAECSAIFPGPQSFTTNSTDSIESGVTCNGATCSPGAFTSASYSYSSSGSFNQSSIVGGTLYAKNNWSHNEGANITFSGSGTAIIYIKNDVTIKKNVDINKGGDPANVLLIFNKKLTIEEGAEINAFIYVNGSETNIEKNSTINGGIAAKTKLILKENSTYTYTPSDAENINARSFCDSPPTPMVNYRFDECSYTGAAFDTLDQMGNYSATSQNFMASTSTGAIERAADLTNYSQHFTTSIPLASDFTVSTWFKKPTSNTGSNIFVLGAMESGGDLLVLDRDNGWYWGIYDGTNTVYSNSYSFASLDDNWHHMVIMYQSGISYLVIDGVWVDTINRAPSGTLKYIGTSVDYIGTSDTQGFRAPLDEFMVFNHTLTLTEMVSIYNNQLAGKNYDASTRTTVSCNPVPIANYRFDECSYTGATNEVLDALNNYHGTVKGGADSTASGKIEQGFDATDYSHYIETSIPLSNDFSVSTWFKKPTATTGSKYFVLGAMSTGGDLIYIDRNNNWRWGVYNASSGESNGTYSFSSLDTNWHHLVLVVESGVTSLYIDGSFVESLNRAPSGTLKYIGTSFDNVNTVNAQGFRAPLDEFIVYSTALTISDISSIYINQSAGNNWDGTSRAATNCSVVGGSCAATFVDAVTNSTTSGYIKFKGSSIVVNNPDTILATATVNNSGSGVTCWTGYCSAGGSESIVPELTANFVDNNSSADLTINGGNATIAANDYDEVKVKGAGTLNFTSSFSSYSFRKLKVEASSTINFTPGDYYIEDLEIKGTSFLNVSGSGTVRIWAKTKAKFKGSSVINGGATGDPSKLFIYYYGDADKVKIESNATVAAYIYSAGKIVIKSSGGRLYGAASAAGELKVKDGAQVWFVDNLASTDFGAACGASIDHYQIIHDGTALTCAAETVTIKACTNAYDGSCTLSTDAVTLNLKGTPTSGSAMTDNITFTGSGTANLSYTTVGTLALSIDSPSITPTNSTVCNDNSMGSCELAFENTGFQFLSAGVASNISTQLSGKPSNIDYNSAILSLQAIKTSPITGACEAAIISNVDIELAAKCENPSTCAGQQVVINSTAIPTVDNASALTYNNVSLDFGSSVDNTAEFTFTYPDAGQVKLYARYNIPVGGSPSGDYMTGNSNSFVVRPLGFYIDIPGNAGATTHASGVFKKAGENFSTTITAMQWKSSDDDADNNGIPDNNDMLSDNSAVLNFNNDSVTLSHNLILPVGGNNPSLSVNEFNSFANGVSTLANMNWPEVGILSFNLGLTSSPYLGTSDITGSIPFVGRFIPAQFALAADVDNGCTNLSYMAQPALTLTYEIEAQTSTGIKTQNYIDEFVHSTVSFVAENNNDAMDLGSRLTDYSSHWSGGSFKPADNNVLNEDVGHFSRNNTVDGPFDNLLIGISIVDTDGVLLNDQNMRADTNGVCTTNYNGSTDATDCNAKVLSSTESQIRFGRWTIPNAYGSEIENLPVPMTAQYWDGTDFVINAEDNCTVVSTQSGEVVLTSGTMNKDHTGVNSITSVFSSGTYRGIELDAPNPSARGNLQFEYQVPTWLKYNWNGIDEGSDSNLFDDNPSAIITFGLFRGNDRIISWREVGN